MVDVIFLIVTIVVLTWLCKRNEWKSNHQTHPPGYHMDWEDANSDLMKYGKDYYYKKHIEGKYYKKDEP